MKKVFLLLSLAAAVPALAHPTVSFDIVPRTRYLLSYKWAATNFPDVVSEPLGQWNVFNNRYHQGPLQELEFFGAGGAPLSGSRDRRFQPLLPGPTGEWRHEFYGPAGRWRMTLTVADNVKKGQTVVLSDIRLTKVRHAPTLNVNPDFALGPYNYAGIAGVNTADEAVMLENPQGGNSFYAGAGFSLLPTPVKAGRRYRVEYAGWGSTSKSYINPSMTFSGEGTLQTVDLPRVTADPDDPRRPMVKSYDFTAPAGAEWVSFRFYYATLDFLRLTGSDPLVIMIR